MYWYVDISTLKIVLISTSRENLDTRDIHMCTRNRNNDVEATARVLCVSTTFCFNSVSAIENYKTPVKLMQVVRMTRSNLGYSRTLVFVCSVEATGHSCITVCIVDIVLFLFLMF